MTSLRRLPALLLVGLLALSLAGCAGDDASDNGADNESVSGSGNGDEGDDGDEEPAETDGEGEETDGTGPAGGVAFVDVTDDVAATITVDATGFDPGESTVAVGDTVQFTAGDDGVYGVIVGDLDGYTVTGGLDEYFRFDEAGTYAVREDISGAEASITVE